MSSSSGLRSPAAAKEPAKMKIPNAEQYEDDADEGNHLSKEEERERKKIVQARIRKEQAEGPAPDMAKRALIFDSLSKIISRTFGKGASRAGVTGETRGTYIFTWGAGYHGQLGRQFERGRKKYATIPKMVHLDIAIRQIACGGLHTAAVTDAGTVYTWGDARAHQLGYQPHGFTNQPTPHLVESLDGVAFVVSIACGQSHTVALTDKGSLISWGQSKSGQCGHNDRQVVKAPRKIRLDDPTVRFSEVSCGDKHTAALTTKGAVWAFGSCQQGQGGFDESPPVDKLKPTEVKALSDAGIIVSSVVCGSIHTCMVTDEGALYICGFGEHFYPNEDQNFFYRPVQVPFHEKVVQVACGQSHIIALTASSDVYTFGSGLYGQLGQGVKGDLNTPRLILTGKNIAQVAAGRYHSVALTSFGTVYAFGCGENGQLGHLSDENVLFPKVLEPNLGTVVGQIACGEHHTAVLTSTPWTNSDPEVLEWLRSEQEEYNLKLKFIKRSNHGLVKKDLLKIQERMAHLKAEWAALKARGMSREEGELQGHVESVKGREGILAEMAEEQRLRDERAAMGAGINNNNGPAVGSQQWNGPASAAAASTMGRGNGAQQQQQSSQNSFNMLMQSMQMDGAAEFKDGGGDQRPDSASRPFQQQQHQQQQRRGSGSMNINAMLAGSQTARAGSASSSGGGAQQQQAPQQFGSKTLLSSTATMAPRRPTAQSPMMSMTARAGGLDSPAGGHSFGTADVVGSNAARCNFLRESAGMVRRMKGIIAESGDASTEQRLKKTIGGVFAFRKDYDTLRNLTRKRLRILEAIQRKVQSLRKNNDSTKNRRKINELLLKALKMKLSTVTIKITETEENRRNYALNIAHLKEEELERFYQLEALRKQCNDNDVFTRKITEMKLQSLEESNKSEQELAEFKAEIAMFHSFISEQLAKFHTISSVAAQRKEKRDQEKTARNAKSHEKINQRIARLTSDLEEKSAEAIAMQNQLESVNERLRYFEKRFQQIASATGLTNPDAIINKFTLKEEIKTELQAEIKAKTALLAEMAEELAAGKAELEVARSEFQESKWKDVDVLYKLVHDSQANATHHANECERLDERLAYYKEGMLALLSMLPVELLNSSPSSQDGAQLLAELEGADIGQERTMQLVQVLGDKLLGLAELVADGDLHRVQRAREQEDQIRQQEALSQAKLAQEIAEKLKMSSIMRRSAGGSAAPSKSADNEEGTTSADEQQQLQQDDEEDEEGEEEDGGDEEQQQQEAQGGGDMQRTQPRQAIPAYSDQQYQVQY